MARGFVLVAVVHGLNAVHERVQRKGRQHGRNPAVKILLGQAAADAQRNALFIDVMREQIVVINIVVVRIAEEVGQIVANFAEINRKIAAVHLLDGVSIDKAADFVHHLIIHDRGIMALRQVGAGQIGLQVAITEGAAIKGHAAGVFNIGQQKVGHTGMGNRIHRKRCLQEKTRAALRDCSETLTKRTEIIVAHSLGVCHTVHTKYAGNSQNRYYSQTKAAGQRRHS